MKAIAKTALPDLFAALKGRVYVPVREGKGYGFALWQGQDWPADYQNTIVPPKQILFPQTEDLYTFRVEGEDITIDPAAPPEEPSFIFGLRPCDYRAIELLDLVFRQGPYLDASYSKRRDNTFLMVLGCKEGLPTCFCTSFGLEPAFAPGADWNMWDLGEILVVEPGTDKGKSSLRVWVFSGGDGRGKKPGGKAPGGGKGDDHPPRADGGDYRAAPGEFRSSLVG